MDWLLYLLLLGICSLYGASTYRFLTTPYKLLFQLILLTFISELWALWLASEFGSNFPIYHILLPIQVAYYGLIFYWLLSKYKLRFLKHSMAILTFLLITINIHFSFVRKDILSFPSFGICLLGLFVVCAALLLYFNMLKSPLDIPILKQALFWFITGSLAFYSVTFFFFGYFNLLVEKNIETPNWGYNLIKITNYIMYTCYFITLWLDGRQGQRDTNSLVS